MALATVAAIGEGLLGGVSVSGAVNYTSTSENVAHLASSFEGPVSTSRKDLLCSGEVRETTKSMV